MFCVQLEMRFVHRVIHQSTATQANKDNEFIIPPWPFKVKKKIVLVKISYCLKNESSSKQFIQKFDGFIVDKFDAPIKWLTKKVKTLFRKTNLSTRFVKIIKFFAHMVKVISVKLLGMLRYVGMSTTIQWKSQIHQNTLKIILIIFLIG